MTKSQGIQNSERAVQQPPKPVIRVLRMAEEDPIVLWKRRARAFLLSGVIHTVLITTFIFACRALAAAAVPSRVKDTTNTIIEVAEVIPQPQDEFKMDFDLDSTLALAEPVQPDEFPIEAPIVDGEPPGLPEQNEEFTGPASNSGSETIRLMDSGGTPKEALDDLYRPILRNSDGGDFSRPDTRGNSGLPPEYQKRLDKAGGKTGKIQITLVWNNLNDLDLHCIDPNDERIFFGNSKAVQGSGGHLDVDRNINGETRTPIENIYFPEGVAPPGKYRVYVDHYSLQGSPDPTYFKVYIKVNDRHFSFSGRISSGQPMHFIYEFTLPPPRKS